MAMVDFCYLTGHPENLPSCFPDWYEDSNDESCSKTTNGWPYSDSEPSDCKSEITQSDSGRFTNTDNDSENQNEFEIGKNPPCKSPLSGFAPHSVPGSLSTQRLSPEELEFEFETDPCYWDAETWEIIKKGVKNAKDRLSLRVSKLQQGILNKECSLQELYQLWDRMPLHAGSVESDLQDYEEVLPEEFLQEAWQLVDYCMGRLQEEYEERLCDFFDQEHLASIRGFASEMCTVKPGFSEPFFLAGSTSESFEHSILETSSSMALNLSLQVHLDDTFSDLSEADIPNDLPTEAAAASPHGSWSTDLQPVDNSGSLDTPLIPAAPGELGPEYPDFPLWEREKMKRTASTTSHCLCRPLITFEYGPFESPPRSLSLQQQKNTDLQLWLELEEAKVALLAEKLALEQSQTRELERQCEVAQKLLSLKSTINALDIGPIDPCRDKEIPKDPGKCSSGHADQRFQCLCGDPTGHESLAQCPSYNQLPCVSQRWQLLKNCNACFRCLKFGHEASTCLEGFCGIDGCKRMHHPSLHIDSLHGRPPSVTQHLYRY